MDDEFTLGAVCGGVAGFVPGVAYTLLRWRASEKARVAQRQATAERRRALEGRCRIF